MQLYNFSDSYINSVEQGALFHKTYKTWAGSGTFQYIDQLLFLKKKYNASSMLDFGCGKGIQFENNKIQNLVGCDISGYDPCIHGLENWPNGKWDIVFCFDVLKQVDDIDIPWILTTMGSWANKAVFVATQENNLGKLKKQKLREDLVVNIRDKDFYKDVLENWQGPDLWIMDTFSYIISPTIK
jgi:hypothetical protein